MQISSDYGAPIVKAFESCLRPVKGRPGFFTTYYCPANVLTIGWGHTNLGGVPPKITEGEVWSQAECDGAFVNDMRKFEGRINRTFAGVPLTQHEFDALVSFDFNTGGIDKSSIPAKIKSGRRNEVAETLSRWNKANGQVLAGLTRRRKSEGELFDGKIEAALRTANAVRGVAMPQRVDRPTPPAAEVAKRAGPEIATIGAGGGTGAAGKASQPASTVPVDAPRPESSPVATAALWIGAALLVAGVILLVRKYKIIDRDWA
jgi:lysozyme